MRRLEQTYQDRIEFHILNIDHLSTQPLAVQYRVSGIPLIVLLEPDGTIFDRLLGYQSEEQLLAAVEQLLAATE